MEMSLGGVSSRIVQRVVWLKGGVLLLCYFLCYFLLFWGRQPHQRVFFLKGEDKGGCLPSKLRVIQGGSSYCFYYEACKEK